jgi:hypothetical protein
MSLFEKLRNVSRIDSRRFSKGTICRILDESIYVGIVELVVKTGLIPLQVQLHERVAVDTENGRIFALPITKLPQLKEEVAALGNIKKDFEVNLTEKGEELAAEIAGGNPLTLLDRIQEGVKRVGQVTFEEDSQKSLQILRREEPIIDFLRQSMVMASIPPGRWPDGGWLIDDGQARYDLLIETLDVGQAIDAQFVIRKWENIRPILRWSEEEENGQ